MDSGVCGTCCPFPAILQDSTWQGNVECRRCSRGWLIAVDGVEKEKVAPSMQ